MFYATSGSTFAYQIVYEPWQWIFFVWRVICVTSSVLQFLCMSYVGRRMHPVRFVVYIDKKPHQIIWFTWEHFFVNVQIPFLWLLPFLNLYYTIGVSIKSQVLYIIVFTARYLDLFTVYISFYNSFMKLIYIASTTRIIYEMKVVEPTKSTYSSTQDEFDILKYSIAPSALLALMIEFTLNSFHFDGLELLWTYSIIQEVTAMVPQLRIAYFNRHIQSEIKLAILFMGLYRFFYILNWIYRANTEANYLHHWVVYICGVLQVAIYSDFFYHAGTYVFFIETKLAKTLNLTNCFLFHN